MSPQGPLVAVQPTMPTSPPPITPDVVASIAASAAARQGQCVICKCAMCVTMLMSIVLLYIEQLKELPAPIMAPNLPNDLFSVLFKCQDNAQPGQALLAHAIPLQHSLLPLLAASYEVSVLYNTVTSSVCVYRMLHW